MNKKAIDSQRQQRAPIFEALLSHRLRKTRSFHVPGHKYGADLSGAHQQFYQHIMSIDTTEITGMDDLHFPEGCILEAEQLAAEAFGAEETLFLVGGSTAGNLAAIYALCEPGDVVIVDRSCHKSVLNGLTLAGAKAVFVTPQVDATFGVPTEMSLDTMEKAIAAYPFAKAAVITSPNYYGKISDISNIADRCHSSGIPLIVDEAHGAHFTFHEQLPPSAIQCGADLVIQSTHKMLGAMTMGAMLHMQGSRIDRHDVKKALTMLQSSSPSYPLMASLDTARRQAALYGRDKLTLVSDQLRKLKDRLSAEYPCYRLLNSEDPFKWYMVDSTHTLSGHRFREQLESKGCMMEMSDEQGILAVFSMETTRDDLEHYFMALQSIALENQLMTKEVSTLAWNVNRTEMMNISSPTAFTFARGKGEWVSLSEAEGRVAADMIVPYPPGIPLCCAGETISAAQAKALEQQIESGGYVQGVNRMGQVRVQNV